MLQDHFQLTRRPFSSVPTSADYFPAASIEAARKSLVRLIERHEGPGLVVGPVGIGKTQLCELVADAFRQRCRVVTLPSGRSSSRRALLQVILFELGLPYRDQDEGELRLSLIDYVMNCDVCPRGLLLLVDEGESLSLALLDELRSLTNLTSDGKPSIRLIVFGAPRLEEKFTHPRMESFNQRIAGRVYLESFSTEETAQFIRQTFDKCGGDASDVFTDEALSKIHRACGGIPRLINQLADHSLVLATLGNHNLVNATRVEEAWADLQQLPMPHDSQSFDSLDAPPSDIVEFGKLDEEDDEVVPSVESGSDEITRETKLIESDEDPVTMVASREQTEEDVGEEESHAEVTLVFHSSNNPFGDDFEEEELVVDHFISPDALAQRHRRQVEAEASQRLADQLYQLRQDPGGEDVPDQLDGMESLDTSKTEIVAHEGLPSPTDAAESIERVEIDATAEDDDFEIISLGDHTSIVKGNRASKNPIEQESGLKREAETAVNANSADPERNYRHLFSQLRMRRG